MDMKIKTKAWHYSLYKTGVKMWCRFTGNNEWEYESWANLCTYIRVIFVYLPSMIAIHLAVYLSWIWIPMWISSMYPTTGVSGGFSAIGWFAFIAFSIVSIAVMLSFLLEYIIPGTINKIQESREKRREAAMLEKTDEEREMSAWQIFVQWSKDRHDKVCRKITFSE